jgi:Cellulose biosynthesis protein BcsS
MLLFGTTGPASADVYVTSGISGGPDSLNGFAGLIWTPFNELAGDGPLFRAWSRGSAFSYRTDLPANPDQRIDVSGGGLQAEAGWQWHLFGARLALLAGAVWNDYRLSPPDPGSSLAGSRFGWSASFDADYPAWNQLGIMANGNYIGPIDQYWVEARPYYQFEAGMRFGPTFAVAGGRDYLKARAGLYVTGYEWRLDDRHRLFFGGEAGAEFDLDDSDLAPFVGVHIGFFY